MSKWIFMVCLPFFLVANEYYGDVPKDFAARVLSKSTELTLDVKGVMELEVTYPENFVLKDLELAPMQDHSSLHYSLAQLDDLEALNEQKKQAIRIEYDPQIEGKHYLDLPLLQFESKEEPKSQHTLYPPSIECEVKMSAEDPLDELEVASPLALDPTPPVELDQYNKKVFFNKAEGELQEVHQKFLKQAPTMKWKWFVWALVMGFVAYKIYQLATKKRSLQNLFATKEDPKEKALRALKTLRSKNLPKKGQYDAFYVEITQIVRHYIEGHYEIKAPEQTTQEFLKVMLGQSVFNDKINNYLSDFLKFADLVKFAKLNPNIEDCHQAEEAAESFILSESEK